MPAHTITCGGLCSHFARTVRARLDQLFPNRWIGRGSTQTPAPLPWPARSPDLTTPDNALWGFVKEQVRRRRYSTDDELKNAIRAAFQLVTPQMLLRMNTRTWRRIKLCYEHGGTHTDILDP